MKTEELIETARELVTGDKGLLAMDESIGSLHARFAKVGIPQTVEYRRLYRELILTTPGIGDCLSGAILFDETLYQSTDKGASFIGILEDAEIIPGIKVDEGTVPLAGFPGEKVTLGLDTLRERLTKYAGLGMRFAKWRAAFSIGEGLPSQGCIDANVHALARYAALCQEAGLVPIVEPEVLMDGDHTIQSCYDATVRVHTALFRELADQRVDIRGLILKSNMVISGLEAKEQASVQAVAEATVDCLLAGVPASVAGVVFLSGGQSPELASAHLNEMEVKHRSRAPWPLTFSYSRAIQQPALEYWKGKPENVKVAQELLYNRMLLNKLAREGEYSGEMEKKYAAV